MSRLTHPLRIAQVAPLFESVPPKLYGGTERVVYHLTEALVTQGHDVTLFASGDSQTSAQLIPQCKEALRLARIGDSLACHMVMMEQVARLADDFDVIHAHIDYPFFPLARRLNVPVLHTMHGRSDSPELRALYREYRDMNMVAISDAMKPYLPEAKWVGTVHHGYPAEQYHFSATHEGYLAFLGRISPEKRPDRAIEIALRSGLPLKIHAKIDDKDREYYETEIRPLIEAHDSIEFLGEIDEAGKRDFLGKAAGFLFPIDWPEPFGLVMIEAMACGTPVIAYNHGSVPEIITDGVSGFIVDSIDESVSAVAHLPMVSRAGVRAAFEARFTDKVMAQNYIALYERLLAEHRFGKVVPISAAQHRYVRDTLRTPMRPAQSGWHGASGLMTPPPGLQLTKRTFAASRPEKTATTQPDLVIAEATYEPATLVDIDPAV